MSNGAKTAFDQPVRKVGLPRPSQDNKVHVTPGTIHLLDPDKAKTILWENNTGGRVTINLNAVKDWLVPLNGVNLSQPQPVDNGDQLAVGVADQLPSSDLRGYEVHCDINNSEGVGNSPPQMSCP